MGCMGDNEINPVSLNEKNIRYPHLLYKNNDICTNGMLGDKYKVFR